VKINRKDVLDALVLLAEHPLGQDDGAPDARTGQGAINVPRILSFTSNDWGWWRTSTMNLDKLAQLAEGEHQDLLPEARRFEPAEQARRVRAFCDEVPKTMKWKLRAKVGDRVQWYELPEEVGH